MQILITTKQFCSGYDTATGRIGKDIQFMKGWSLEDITDYCKRKGWKLEIIEDKIDPGEYYGDG